MLDVTFLSAVFFVLIETDRVESKC